MNTHIVPEFTLVNALGAIVIAGVYITLASLVKEPNRQKLNAIVMAGAGAVYWSGGLGIAEFVFGSIMLFIAFKGLTNYYFIVFGWLMHTSWDIVHHLYANPIVYLSPSSSAGCAICDTILATWFFYKAPSIFNWYSKSKKPA